MSPSAAEPLGKLPFLYLQARRRLRQQRDVLHRLFVAAVHSANAGAAEILTLPEGREGESFAVIGAVSISPALRAIENMETELGTRDIYAGAVTLVLDDIIQPCAEAFKNAKQGEPAPIIAGFSIPRILKATGNNFRHYDDWKTEKPNKRQRWSIEPIAALLGVPLSVGCANHPFNHVAAWDVLNALSGGSYEDLEGLVRASIDNMVAKAGFEDTPGVKWARAEDGVV